MIGMMTSTMKTSMTIMMMMIGMVMTFTIK
jgi:hypothetical protein